MDFRLKDGETFRTVRCTIASATVIEPGDLVTLDGNKLVIKAVAGSTELAWCEQGSADGETVCEVSKGNDFTLVGTGDANFADTDKGLEVDLVVNANVQEIDLGENTTKVLKVGISETTGVVGSDANIEVKINKPLF
jgi:hypothetical protein